MNRIWEQSAGNIVDLAWLCGFIDGEGCFQLRRRAPWGKQKRLTFQPELVICNTHFPSLERASQIFSSLGVGSYISKPNPSNLKKHPSWKPSKRIVVAGQKRMKTVLDAILPMLFTKKQQAEVMVRFLALRAPKDTRDVYGPEEFALVEELRNLNQRGSSETTRIPPLDGDDIVQP